MCKNQNRSFQKTIFTFFFLLLVNVSFAQNKFKLGLMGNAAVTKLHSNTEKLVSDGSGLGFGFGLLTDWYFSENYALGTGLGVMNQRFGISFNNKDTIEGKQYKLRNLEIPFALKFQSNPISKIRLVGNFGGILGANIFATKTEVFKYQNGNQLSKPERDASADINLFNVQFVIGGGIFYPLSGDTGIEALIDYKSGLTDVLDGNEKSGTLNTIGLRLALIF